MARVVAKKGKCNLHFNSEYISRPMLEARSGVQPLWVPSLHVSYHASPLSMLPCIMGVLPGLVRSPACPFSICDFSHF